MSGFLYFIDGLVNPLTEKHIADYGLGYAFERKPMSGRIDGRTPSGSSGTLLADETRLGSMDMVYRLEDQVWRKYPGSASVYVGFYKNTPPTPATLSRDKQVKGESVELAGSLAWMVPRLRFWAGEDGYQVCLPSRAGIDDDGNWIIDGLEENQSALDALADRLYAGMVLALINKAEPLENVEALDALTTLLGVNYVVSKAELGVLRCLPLDQRLIAALRSAIDLKRVEDWVQKKTTENDPADEIG